MKVKNAFAVRSHFFGEREKLLYRYVEEYFGKENTYLVIHSDDEKLKIPSEYNHIIYNRNKILSSKDLFWPDDCGWRCGDYSYYALNKKIKEKGYDFIWMGEPDIKICSKRAGEFFEQCNDFKHDFLASGLGVAREQLFFYHTGKVLGDRPPISCIFPLTRLRVKKIDKLYEIRKKVSRDFIERGRNPADYPNDEIFIATICAQLKFSSAPLDKISSFNFRLFNTDHDNAILEEDAKDLLGKFIIHPVLDEKLFIEKKLRTFRTMLSNQSNRKNLSHWAKNILIKTNNDRVKKILSNEFKKLFGSFLDSKIS